MWMRRSGKMAAQSERAKGLLLAAEICRHQRPFAPPDECARAIERAAEEILSEYTIVFDNQTVLHDDGGW